STAVSVDVVDRSAPCRACQDGRLVRFERCVGVAPSAARAGARADGRGAADARRRAVPPRFQELGHPSPLRERALGPTRDGTRWNSAPDRLLLRALARVGALWARGGQALKLSSTRAVWFVISRDRPIGAARSCTFRQLSAAC